MSLWKLQVKRNWWNREKADELLLKTNPDFAQSIALHAEQDIVNFLIPLFLLILVDGMVRIPIVIVLNFFENFHHRIEMCVDFVLVVVSCNGGIVDQATDQKAGMGFPDVKMSLLVYQERLGLRAGFYPTVFGIKQNLDADCDSFFNWFGHSVVHGTHCIGLERTAKVGRAFVVGPLQWSGYAPSNLLAAAYKRANQHTDKYQYDAPDFHGPMLIYKTQHICQSLDAFEIVTKNGALILDS